ncbi:Uncharacterized protein dnm_080030 [Desulfonema magnum]|uniref:Uncharacterized protein n=1 Tax=Desulfonema magnum TaxID=45655 RepID=A0A975BVL1_9BACT|nr:Uncharacterized protein dnm_080030 [Desulfonema magnum]
MIFLWGVVKRLVYNKRLTRRRHRICRLFQTAILFNFNMSVKT